MIFLAITGEKKSLEYQKKSYLNKKRVAATPEMVQKYIKMGFYVKVEPSAGEGVWKSDE